MLRGFVLSGRSLRTSVVAVASSGFALVNSGVFPMKRQSFSSGPEKIGNDAPAVAASRRDMSPEEKKANDLMWEEKAKSCPLCRLFLESPCAEEFKIFSDCADRAKEKGEEVSVMCGESDFVNMRKCMLENPDHFEILFEAEEGIVADDDNDDDNDDEEQTPQAESQ